MLIALQIKLSWLRFEDQKLATFNDFYQPVQASRPGHAKRRGNVAGRDDPVSMRPRQLAGECLAVHLVTLFLYQCFNEAPAVGRGMPARFTGNIL